MTTHITVIGKSTGVCAGLTELHLPDSVTSIENAHSKTARSDRRITASEFGHLIGNEAFRNVKIEGNLVLPSALTFLGTDVFNETTISSVTFPGTLKILAATHLTAARIFPAR